MRQLLLIATATVLGFATVGCDFLPFGQDDTTTTDPTVVEQSPVAVSPASPNASPNFEQPTVAQENPPRGILPPDLISSTDPNQRVQQVKGNRNDPFALLPTTPTVQLPEGVTQPAPTVIVPLTPPNRTTGSGAQPRGTTSSQSTAPRRTTTPNAGRGGSPNQATTPPKNPVGPRSPITNPSPRPQPELARAVQVTGVVQVGDTVYAIVKAPNEPSSRYVQEGQRLSNGQVLVRRIETNRVEPVVILEQYGVEVVRAVGEGGAPTTPAASVPASTTPTS